MRPPEPTPSPSRRQVFASAGLVAAAGVALAGCRGSDWYDQPVSVDESVLRSAITAKRRLLARYDVTQTQGGADGPDDPETLDSLVQRHHEHVDLLEGRLPERTDTEPLPEPTLGPEPEAPLSAAALAVAERGAAARHAQLASEAEDPSLAQLLSSISASEVGHAWILER
ncbi:ferritin-like domain-containing protein [Spiractinospora alimapuensis]|uniref:ferritin-like domain-containing protein n=1 Tax=Spiractinospora alimapuensis TaxID=2820884 RepID=UPI001F3ACF0C|nr:ferritin-like domain-containing protein [Spiractinospora alimapuensis]QVQ53664.1 ferritin-like domain-containing protein [Spiractinospora alimapuensis]